MIGPPGPMIGPPGPMIGKFLALVVQSLALVVQLLALVTFFVLRSDIFLSNGTGTPSAAVHQSLPLPTSFSLFWRGWTRGNGPEIKIKIQILLILYSKPIGLKIPPFSIGQICKIITPREIIITPREKFSLLGTYTPLRYAPALVRKIFHSG